jgi:alkylhydroperoxidase/carboxymuconolactone decarboxylase family protein YurZ
MIGATMKIPGPYMKMKAEHPALMDAYESFGDACSKAGPLDEKTVALVKLGISLAAGLEGAAHSHSRKALEAGCKPAELLHVAHLCAPTIGFPGMMRARGWVAETIKEQGGQG